uniref:HK97 family phage portal protein n=1 Tax=biofilter metagenome TaxID=1070537 RepID=A0A193SBN6_9ZZZZ
MNFIRRSLLRLALKGTDLSLTEPRGWSVLGGVGPTWAKVNVNDLTQLQISSAFSAVRLISEVIGSLPLHLYRTTETGRQRAKDDYRYEFVHEQPNEYMTAAEWIEAMCVSLATQGQAYSYVSQFESTGRIVSIQPVLKTRVTPEIRSDGGLIYHLSLRNGRTLDLAREQILPVRGFGAVGELEGFAPHRLHGNSMALTVALDKYASDFFGSGGRPNGILSTKAEFGEKSRDQIRAGFAKYLQDSREKGELPVLDGETEYIPVSTPNNEAQFLESRKHQIGEMARIYRVPLRFLMEDDQSSYANDQQANKHLIDYTLSPYTNRIEKALNSCLLTREERRSGMFFKFDYRGLLRGDSAQRAEYYNKMRQAGAISQNEIRDLEDMDRRGPDCDELMVPLNMAPNSLLQDILVGDKSTSRGK